MVAKIDAGKQAPLVDWPWEKLGSWKYILFLPLVTKMISSNFLGGHEVHNFSLHILVISVLRCVIYQLWQTYSRCLFLVKKHQIRTEGVGYNQIDREWHCDNPIILQALLAAAAHTWFPFFTNLPLWNSRGLWILVLLHAGLAEPLFYWIHRGFHSEYLFANYHSLHHASETTEPATAGTSTFLEQLMLAVIVAVPILGTSLVGDGSIAMLYVYLLVFEFLRNMGHCNVEVVPASVFRIFPPLRYLLYTPSYHALHHEHLNSNFCLFMPLYDYLGQTVDKSVKSLHEELRRGRKQRIPDFVFLLHVVDQISCLHVPFVFRTFASVPFSTQWFLFPFWPFTTPVMFAMWIWGKPFAAWNYFLRNRLHQIWVIPRFGFQYFLPFAKDGINNLIEEAILKADNLGVKVISLAALNKNEALNGGGTLFVERHKNLKVRVVHGNTLTAAVILNEIPKDIKEVFLTGSTSKLGRAIALYLSKKGVRVLMLTTSRERFESIKREVDADCQKNLIQVTKYQAAKNCKTWIVGKWLHYSEQKLAPPGTYFHQFVVPPVIPFRRDCTYGKLAAVRLPEDLTGLPCCEYTLDRNVVHACHAGGVVHALEGWDHHEVGAIDVDRIDLVWEAALRRGLHPVQSCSI